MVWFACQHDQIINTRQVAKMVTSADPFPSAVPMFQTEAKYVSDYLQTSSRHDIIIKVGLLLGQRRRR